MPWDSRHRPARLAVLLTAALSWTTPAPAQLIGGGVPGLGLPGLPGTLPDVGSTLRGATRNLDGTVRGPLEQIRRLEVRRLLRDHRDVVEPDDRGQPVVRGEILALALTPAALERLKAAGFTVRRDVDLGGLGLQVFTLGAPPNTSAIEAVRRLRALDPQGQYDFNHLYQDSGAILARETAAAAGAGDGHGRRIGLVDGSAAASRPSLAGVQMVQQAFAPGGPRPTAHATAIASLIAGRSGSARGATLYVADVYGSTGTGGSAQAVAQGLAWLAQARVAVINISLVGPPNIVLEASVKALVARGHLLVAAVGNDGPAAPPLYPAAYPGVVAVTGVDARRRVLPEAGRGLHVDFAAQGSDMAGAGLDGGLVKVRGTSFAAPLVAGALARLIEAPDPAAAAQAVDTLGRSAIDLGAPGPDPVYGRGLVGADRR